MIKKREKGIKLEKFNSKKQLTKEEIVARSTTHNFVSVKDLLLGLKSLQRLLCQLHKCPGAKKKHLDQALLELQLWIILFNTQEVWLCFLHNELENILTASCINYFLIFSFCTQSMSYESVRQWWLCIERSVPKIIILLMYNLAYQVLLN